MPNRIPLDPVLPKNFDCTPNEKRSKAQLDAWWDHPYGVTQPDGKIVVYCLNGGAWTVHPCFVWQITMMKPVNLPKDSRQAG